MSLRFQQKKFRLELSFFYEHWSLWNNLKQFLGKESIFFSFISPEMTWEWDDHNARSYYVVSGLWGCFSEAIIESVIWMSVYKLWHLSSNLWYLSIFVTLNKPLIEIWKYFQTKMWRKRWIWSCSAQIVLVLK